MRLVARAWVLLVAIGVMLSIVLAGRVYRDLGGVSGPLIQAQTTADDLRTRPLNLPVVEYDPKWRSPS
jgi:hypothetical protein